MKTLLTINGERFLVHKPERLDKILDLFRDLTPLRNCTVYGPEGEMQFSREFYLSADVLDPCDTRVRVELVPDTEVFTREAFEMLKEQIEQKKAKWVEEQGKREALQT